MTDPTRSHQTATQETDVRGWEAAGVAVRTMRGGHLLAGALALALLAGCDDESPQDADGGTLPPPPATRLDPDDLGDVGSFHLIGDAEGDAIVVFARGNTARAYDDPVADIWAARFDAASGWESPVKLGGGGPGAFAYAPLLAGDASGNALATWYSDAGISTARYARGSGWTEAAPYVAPWCDVPSCAHAVAIALGADGRGMGLFGGTGGTRLVPWTTDGGWGEPQEIELAGNLAVDDDGNAWIVGVRNDEPGAWRLASQRCDADATCAPLEDLGAINPDQSIPTLATNHEGDGIVVYFDGQRAVARRSSAGSAWSPPEALPIEAPRSYEALHVPVSLDDAGTARITFRVGGELATSTSPSSSGWSEPTVLERYWGGARPSIATDGTGHGLALWNAVGSTTRIAVASTDDAGAWMPPVTLAVEPREVTVEQLGVTAAGDGLGAAVWITRRDEPYGHRIYGAPLR